MLAVIFHQFNYFLNSYDCMYKKDKLPIHAVFFLSSPNKQTLEVIKYLVIEIISSTLSLLWQENVLKTMQSNSNYRGEKLFTPQFGDSFSDTAAKQI